MVVANRISMAHEMFKTEEMVVWLSKKGPMKASVAMALVGAWINMLHYLVIERIEKDPSFIERLQCQEGFIRLSAKLVPEDWSTSEMMEVLQAATGLSVEQLDRSLVMLSHRLTEIANRNACFEPLGRVFRYEQGFKIRLISDFIAPVIDEPQLQLPEEYVSLDEDSLEAQQAYAAISED